MSLEQEPQTLPNPNEAADRTSGHFGLIAREIADGRVIPFLGAGVNLCGRLSSAPWQQGQSLPSGGELAKHLAEQYGYPLEEILVHCPKCQATSYTTDTTQDLVRSAQYVDVMAGSGPLYGSLRRVFDGNFQPTAVHRFLAGIPGTLRDKGANRPYQLIITTNYDDLLERAFDEVGEPYDIVAYNAQGEKRGKFWHYTAHRSPTIIEQPNQYLGLPLEKRTVILKLHGMIDRSDPDKDSYVISEDDFLDYLARSSDLSNLVPATILAKLRTNHLLFLGYALRDWSLRVILLRIAAMRRLSWKWWAVQLNPQSLDRKFWRR